MDLRQDDSWWQRVTRNYGGKPTDLAIYLKMLEIFCDTGEVAGRGVAWPEDEPWREYDDPLLAFLTSFMSDPDVKAKVLSSRMCAKVFQTTVGRFVVDCIHHQAFLSQSQRVEARHIAEVEDQSSNTTADIQSWLKLIEEVGEKHVNDGFDAEFYKRMFQTNVSKDNIDKMLDDWGKAISEHLRQEEDKYVKSHGASLKNTMSLQLQNTLDTMSRVHVTDEQAVQAWRKMNGYWSETEFLRRVNDVRIQDRYPQLAEVVDKMGRGADGSGKERLTLSDGQIMKINHSSGSDITGITIGTDLGSLLPVELAMYADETMEDIFFYRYTRHRLQTFEYKSKMKKPSRKLSFYHARRVGPMIVCVDTSASMYGTPQRIVQSLLSLLEEKAERLHRNCFLIDFSVGIKTIDLKQRMKQNFYTSIGLKKDEMTFDKGQIPFIGGGTDARNMMEATFRLLNSSEGYINADVLWISDFFIPIPGRLMLDRMDDFRRTGTRFYGLCIRNKGEKEAEWSAVFDKIYNVEYRIIRRF